MNRNQIIKAIDDYAAATELKPSTICQYAVANRHAYDRLVSGSLAMKSAEQIMVWLAENPPTKKGDAA